MADEPSQNQNDSASPETNPNPEVLQPREHNAAEETADKPDNSDEPDKGAKPKIRKLPLRTRHHLSHKATFIGLVVVVIILAVNAAIVVLVIDRPDEEEALSDQVTINEEALESLGINRATLDDTGVELTVGPHANFERSVQIAGDLSVGGELTLNENLSATDISTDVLQAGDASFDELNVSGDGTLTNIIAREDLTVAGTSRLQGPTTIDQLLTVENHANISGNLTVGGALSVNAFNTNNLTVGGTMTLGGHIITRGAAPSASAGPAAGSNGTVSISGNDTAGTVGFNAGTGAGNGVVANITFSTSYSSTPHVVITPIGDVGNFYISRSQSGFSIGIGNSVDPGGYAFDYIVMQ